jgi:hypothetical protein
VTSSQPATTDSSKTAITAQTQATLSPIVGIRVGSPSAQFWYLTAGLGGAILIALTIWYIRRQRSRRRKEIVQNAARARVLQRTDSLGSAFNDLRSDVTPHRDVGPSAERPMPVQSNFQKSDRRRLDILAERERARVRWAGLSATTSEANIANIMSVPGAASGNSTIGRSEFFDTSMQSDESEFDVIRREEPINEAYKQFRLESRDLKLQQGHRTESAMSVNDSILDIDDEQPLILVPDMPRPPTIRLFPPSHPGGPPLHRPPAAQLRPEHSPRRLQEIQPHEIRFRHPVPIATTYDGPRLLSPEVHYQPEDRGLHSQEASLVEGDITIGLGDTTIGGAMPAASENLSQVDFGVWTEASFASFTETEISDDVLREDVLRNRRVRE